MKEQLLETLKNSRNYTLSVAEAMPQGSYDFKPSAEVWNYGEQMNHIAYGITWCIENYINGREVAWNEPPAKDTREDNIAYLNEVYDALKSTVENQEITGNAAHGFYATIDHITHHRAQAVIYLRCNGITPPGYIY